ncbi:MAG: hypothetical protein NC389_00665 [Acetatifactor muris]|nr:hypothetical protein [Acetatifactor muris]
MKILPTKRDFTGKTLSAIFLILTVCILSHSSLSLSYASLGLELWFRKMVPALLPFMILSGIMIRLKLTEKMAGVLYPVAGPVYRVRKNVVYCMALGFLCGFPMGARVTADLYEREMLTRREAEYLLAFCNNIGPVYFCSFVLPLLGRRLVLPYLFGMYGIPLLYGLFLRFTAFRTLPEERTISSELCMTAAPPKPSLLTAVNESVQASLHSILLLGGYMILFNLLNLPFHILLGREPALLSPVLEITGGLSMLGSGLPLYSLLALSFGGLSCIAQTYSCISATDLALGGYIRHKVVLTLLNGFFYLCWFLFSPASFLL